MQLIVLNGLASGKKWQLKVSTHDLDRTLLDFLRIHNIPVASSCDGDKVCQLCKVNENLLACNLLVKEIINQYNSTIEITYL